MRLHFANLHLDQGSEKQGLPVTITTVDPMDPEDTASSAEEEQPQLAVTWRHVEAEQLFSGQHPLQWNPIQGPILHKIPVAHGTTYSLEVALDDSAILVKYPFSSLIPTTPGILSALEEQDLNLRPEMVGCLVGKVRDFLEVLLLALLDGCTQLHQPEDGMIGRLNTEFVWRLNYKESTLELIHQRGTYPVIMVTPGTVWKVTKRGKGGIVYVVNRVQSVLSKELPQPTRVVNTTVVAETN